jgi:hypothetical protein
MTSDTVYTLEEYLSYVRDDPTSRHLLVEGSDDRRAFAALFSNLLQGDVRESISIDTADTLIEAGPENREIIESICSMVVDREYAHRFAGFADREYRGFACEPELFDSIRGHGIFSRLIWSRGHSIENYFLETDILSDPLMMACPDGFGVISRLYQAALEPLICAACAIGLAAREVRRLKRVRPTIGPEIIVLEEHDLRIDVVAWRTILEHRGLRQEVDLLLDRYTYWNAKARSSDIEVVRWLCDGHMAFRLIWAAYEKCLMYTSHRLAPAPHDDLRFNMCAVAWARVATTGACEYPAAVIRLLGLAEDMQRA